ncbi:hypothetical protein [Candidatus Regiella endosymbiont of Tuberolachnus salignus]|uniref:OspG family effector kinase n=1 Tax=Candidatus Regiella endosymbiont of Tuberolachnus salignus TaxID=3077956 RepID=UPI0030D4690C
MKYFNNYLLRLIIMKSPISTSSSAVWLPDTTITSHFVPKETEQAPFDALCNVNNSHIEVTPVITGSKKERPKFLNIFEIKEGGEIIGQGAAGIVRKDPKNPGFVIKNFNKNYELACTEAKLFNQYYGEGSAEVLSDGNPIRVRMLKVPGKSLDKCEFDELPKDSKLLFLKMISELNELKIIHGDMHPGNIMFDPTNKRFWPIDLSNGYSNYYSSHEARNMMNIDDEHRFNVIMQLLP